MNDFKAPALPLLPTMAGRLLNLRPWMVGLHLQAGPGSRYWLFLLRMQEITDKRKGNEHGLLGD